MFHGCMERSHSTGAAAHSGTANTLWRRRCGPHCGPGAYGDSGCSWRRTEVEQMVQTGCEAIGSGADTDGSRPHETRQEHLPHERREGESPAALQATTPLQGSDDGGTMLRKHILRDRPSGLVSWPDEKDIAA